jgi:hypothetical protein
MQSNKIESMENVRSNKIDLWKILLDAHGFDEASNIMFPIFLFPKDRKVFESTYDKTNLYILKNTNNGKMELGKRYWDIINHRDSKFNKIQQYSKHPLLFHGYKTNFRIFILLECSGDSKKVYMYNNGSVTYTMNADSNVMSYGNLESLYKNSRFLYLNRGFPMTITELRRLKTTVPWSSLFDNFSDKIIRALNTDSKLFCNKLSHNYGSKTFQLLSVDFFVDTNYNSKILDMQFGPGIISIGEEDKKMLTKINNDLLSTMKLIKTPTNGFRQIWNN